MPLYEYECKECGLRVELLLNPTSSTSLRECKSCGGVMKKQISVPSKPQFNGTGFYETDYKSKKG